MASFIIISISYMFSMFYLSLLHYGTRKGKGRDPTIYRAALPGQHPIGGRPDRRDGQEKRRTETPGGGEERSRETGEIIRSEKLFSNTLN